MKMRLGSAGKGRGEGAKAAGRPGEGADRRLGLVAPSRFAGDRRETVEGERGDGVG